MARRPIPAFARRRWREPVHAASRAPERLKETCVAMIDRRDYAALYGPTTGDAVRLGDTTRYAVVEHDHAVYGDEGLHGGGESWRDGIGMAGITSAYGALDFLLCNVLASDIVIGLGKR